MSKDYYAWLRELRGEAVPGGMKDAVQRVTEDDGPDYTFHEERISLFVSDIAIDRSDPAFATATTRINHDIEIPRNCDVLSDLKSNDPRVIVSLSIGPTLPVAPAGHCVLLAAQYSAVKVRISSVRSVLEPDADVGFSYRAHFFKPEHRLWLAQGGFAVSDIAYDCGTPWRQGSPGERTPRTTADTNTHGRYATCR